LLEARKAELIDQLQQYIQVKKKNLAVQKDEVETVHAQLASCLSFVRESLRTGSQGEVMKMKKAVVKQIKEMTDNFKPDMLPPCEPANVGFISSPEFALACQQFGDVYIQNVSPEKCFQLPQADRNNNRIQVFTAEGQFLRKFGKKGSGNGELDCPVSISIDREDVVYVTEENNHRVSVFTCEGKFLTTFGRRGSGPGQFRCPRGIAVDDKNGVVYVSDHSNDRLQLF
jgi:hypothetical protein